MGSRTRVTNYEKLQQATDKHQPFILFDVEATGIMNGNDNHITQIALTAFNWNNTTGRYELQDNLFMLAKAQPDTLAEIERRQRPTKENAERILKSEYVYAYRNEIARAIQNSRNRQNTFIESTIPRKKGHIERCTPRQVKKREGYKKQLEELYEDLENERTLEENLTMLYDYVSFEDVEHEKIEYIDECIQNLCWDNIYQQVIGKRISSNMYSGSYQFYKPEDDPEGEKPICYNIYEFLEAETDKKIALLEEYESLDSTLRLQGIDKGKWVQDGLGLTVGEMQAGINEFLRKYKTPETVFVTNGAYYAKHYMKKDGIDVTGGKEPIDMIQVEKSRGHAPETNKWSANVGDFAESYLQETGKEIKTFDAYTKALCYAEMIAKATDKSVSLRSVNQLANAVTEKAASMDEDYVMSATRASTLNWNIVNEYRFDHSDFHFNTLEYVNFGNDRKYVDLDKMFEVNNDFEVTLEGEKTPIKTWEELENKIKALNSNISEELLEQIKFKYEELEQKAAQMKQDYIETRENIRAITEEEWDEIVDEWETEDEVGQEQAQTTPEKPASKESTLQQRLSKIIEQYDTDLRALEDLQKEADEELQDTLKIRAEQAAEDIAAMEPYIRTVVEKSGAGAGENFKFGKSPKEGCPYCFIELDEANDNRCFAVKYDTDEGVTYFYCGEKGEFQHCQDTVMVQSGDFISFVLFKDSLTSYPEILENWDSIKEQIIEAGQNALKESLNKKSAELEEKRQHVKKFKKEDMER